MISTFSSAVNVGDEVEELKDETNTVTPVCRALLCAQRLDIVARHDDPPPLGRLFDSADEVEQRGLSGTRRAQQHDELARPNYQIHILECLDGRRPGAVRAAHTLQLQRRISRCRCGLGRRFEVGRRMPTHNSTIAPPGHAVQ